MSDAEAAESHARSEEFLAELFAMRKSLEENTKATAAMSGAIRMIYLVPLALAAMSLTGWLLWQGKIGEINFTAILMVCLTPFFGEGVGRVLERLPLVGKQVSTVQNVALTAFLLGNLFLAGCALMR